MSSNDDPTIRTRQASLKPHRPLEVPWLNPDQIAPAVVFPASDRAALATNGDPAHDAA